MIPTQVLFYFKYVLVTRCKLMHFYTGHGKSAAFPPGVVVSQIAMVEVIRGIAEHMKWTSFVYMCHSMGFIIGNEIICL